MGKTDPPPRKRQKAGEDQAQAQQEVRGDPPGGSAVPGWAGQRQLAYNRSNI